MKTTLRVLLGGALGMPVGFIGLTRIALCFHLSDGLAMVMGLLMFTAFPVFGGILGAWCAYKIIMTWDHPRTVLLFRASALCALAAGTINLYYQIDSFARSGQPDFDNSFARFAVGAIVGGAAGVGLGAIINRMRPRPVTEVCQLPVPTTAAGDASSLDDVWPPAPCDRLTEDTDVSVRP